MRLIEIILLLTVTLLPFLSRKITTMIRPRYLLIFLGAILVLHLALEGYRWQMIPAYLLTIITGWRMMVTDASRPSRISFFRIVGFLAIFLLIILAWMLPSILPVFTLPEPRGSYAVGSELIYVQTDNDEVITEDPSDKRELLYKIWYPSDTDVSSMKGEKYVDSGSRAGFATKYGLPSSALNYLDHVKTYVYPDIPVARGRFPVLIFSHGYGSKATGYYALLSELASHGYVIINMNHTYESLGATFPDGRIANFDYGFQGKISAGSMENIQPIIDAFDEDLSYQERHEIIREPVKNYFESDIQDRWAEDIHYTLDLLTAWNSDGLLNGKLNLDKVGVIGHSVGGGTAGNIAIRDPRIKAAANLDGIQWGDKIDTIYHIPYLYVSADWPADHEDINSHVYKYKSSDYFYETKLLNSGHPNFMDIPFMIPVRQLAGTGTIDPLVGMTIVSDLVISFFDTHLKNASGTAPQEISQAYELLEMKVYEGDSVK
jgi:dienelactone hydrolase